MSFNAKDGAIVGAATAAAAVAAGVGTYVASKWIEAGAGWVKEKLKKKEEVKPNVSGG